MIVNTYSYELKKKAVELYFEGHPAENIAKENGIKNRRRVTEWVRIVRDTGTFDSLHAQRGYANAGKKRSREFAPEKENERLRMEIYYLENFTELKGKEAAFRYVQTYRKLYPISFLVEIFGVSRSGYYKWRNRG